MHGLKVMSSNDKINVKAIKKVSFFTGFYCLFLGLFISVFYQEWQYRSDRNIFILGFIFSGIGIICITLSAIRKEKFNIFRVFITIWLVEAFFVLALTFFYSAYSKRLMLGLLITSFLAFGILFINETANRLLFGINDRKKLKTIYNEVRCLDKVNLNEQSDEFDEITPNVDTISSEFAVGVLGVTLYLGEIFSTFAYLFFVPNQATPSFFGSIDVKTVALATAGLVTFFWAAKAAKNKSIELEEKKQDGKRRDKEIKMAEARDTAQLIAKASELLGSESDAQKNAGLAFLNKVASQKNGPLQKEAFDLMADFILSATDTTTSNKPRMRAIIYVDDLLEESCRHFAIYEFIVISASDGAEPNDAINDLNSLRIKNLYITFIGLAFGARAIHWATHSKNDYQFSFVNCKLDGRRISEPPEIIKNILVTNCYINNFQIFYICNMIKNSLVQIHNSVTKEFKFVNAIPKKYLPKNEKSINRFLECDFSSSKNWKDTRSNIEAGQEKDIFDRCFYYAGHPPYGFGEEGDDALLTEISSEQQFDELIDDPFLMKYSPPDDKKRQMNKNTSTI